MTFSAPKTDTTESDEVAEFMSETAGATSESSEEGIAESSDSDSMNVNTPEDYNWTSLEENPVTE